jgi:hypothetical protein
MAGRLSSILIFCKDLFPNRSFASNQRQRL